jgi:CDP-glucose 4,6-dehydratase
VIGGGDWAEDRLVPDLLRAFATGQPALIRNPMSTRPWQHVLEPLSGYLMLAEALWHKGGEVAEAWNFGPRDEDARPVQWIVKQMVCRWGQGASWTRDEASHPHEASFLKLDTSKARARLGWEPVWDLAETLRRIVDWHKAWLSNADMRTHCLSEIDDYTSSRRERIEMASSA